MRLEIETMASVVETEAWNESYGPHVRNEESRHTVTFEHRTEKGDKLAVSLTVSGHGEQSREDVRAIFSTCRGILREELARCAIEK